jgi:hypothetical protein
VMQKTTPEKRKMPSGYVSRDSSDKFRFYIPEHDDPNASMHPYTLITFF